MPAHPALPFRQHDASWGGVVIVSPVLVRRAAHAVGGTAPAEAASLFRDSKDSARTMATDGCQICCLAMVLHLLDRPRRWTPLTLHKAATEFGYYTNWGAASVQLYADLLLDATNGEVQLCAKEEYLAGYEGWDRHSMGDSWIVQAYGAASPSVRRDFAVMLKTGTHDDSFASHYVLLDPRNPPSPGEVDPPILDPASIGPRRRLWRLSDSARQIKKDKAIAREWSRYAIKPWQISGAYLFGRWRTASDASLIQPMLDAWAKASTQQANEP